MSIDKSRAENLKCDAASNITNDRVPLVTNFHHSNLVAQKTISRNFQIVCEDSMTRNIFNKPPLKAFRHAKNLKDLLVSLPQNLPQQSPGTFPCNRTVCRRSPRVNSSSIITTPKRHVNITTHFSCITEHVVYCLSCTVSIDSVFWGDCSFENTAEMSSTGGMTFRYLPTSIQQITHWRGHEGSGIEGRPSQPGLLKEAGDEADI